MTVPQNSVVTRVVEYEPPLKITHRTSPSPVTAPAPKPRHLHAVPDPGHPSSHRRAATAFADAALRTVLEVMDQRRPGNQLRPLMAGGLADTVVALRRTDAVGQRHATAVLRRIRLQAVDPREDAFEVTASYSRAPRLRALACRVELVSTVRGTRWQVTALHIG
ncbi:Rv3235 family protein [soil metagenome]